MRRGKEGKQLMHSVGSQEERQGNEPNGVSERKGRTEDANKKEKSKTELIPGNARPQWQAEA